MIALMRAAFLSRAEAAFRPTCFEMRREHDGGKLIWEVVAHRAPTRGFTSGAFCNKAIPKFAKPRLGSGIHYGYSRTGSVRLVQASPCRRHLGYSG